MSQEDFVVDFGDGNDDILAKASTIGDDIEFIEDPNAFLQNAINTGETDLTSQTDDKQPTQNTQNTQTTEINEEEELPLLDELGIDLKAIGSNMLHHINPFSLPNVEETDIIGSILILMVLGISMLFLGKIHFGLIYGYSIIAITLEYFVMNLLSQKNIDYSLIFTHFSYCLFPNIFYVIILVILNIFKIHK